MSDERADFEAHLKGKLKSDWLYNNPSGHELVDHMVSVIPAEIDGYAQRRAGEYVTPWVETMWQGWHARALAAQPPGEAAVQPTAEARDAARLEAVAKAIYEQWAEMPGYVPWVAGGNSHKQTEARQIASAAMKETP